MLTATHKTTRSSISKRIHDVQANWSRNERRQRAIEASQRIQEFLSLISLPNPAPEIWAVGAPVLADFRRIAS